MKVYDDTAGTGAQAEPDRVKVGIAEYEVTTDGAALTTSGLGSCLGVGLYDPEAGVAGLVHVMLPTAEDVGDANEAKFADTGIRALADAMEAAGASVDRLEARIAGGSDMLDFSENGNAIGLRNTEEVEATLSELGIPVRGRDVGGGHGRSLRLKGNSGELVVKSANAGRETL